MPRRATGQVVVDSRRKSPVYAIRFNANGRRQYVTLGSARDGWTQAKAQDSLEKVLGHDRNGLKPLGRTRVCATPTARRRSANDLARSWLVVEALRKSQSSLADPQRLSTLAGNVPRLRHSLTVCQMS
jgi:hypothetical protein